MNHRCRGLAFCLAGVALLAILLVCGPGRGEPEAGQSVAPVRFSRESGFYDDSFYLEMACDSGEIRYTLDSSEPDEHSLLYTGPVLVEDASGNPNVYSMIDDVCIELRSDILKVANREPRYGFTTPKQPVDKATVIRAVCIDAFGNRSDVVNGVYFVGFDKKEAYDGMNIISITTDPDNLFDFDSGIYVLGKTFDDTLVEGAGVPPAIANFGNWAGNYKNRGSQWEREAHICFFDTARNLTLSGDYGIRIQGGASRYMLPKSLNIYARKRYGSESIPAQPLFGEDWQLHSLNLNAGGQGVETKIHDLLVNTLVADCDVLTREYEPYELFLDGEYWGVYWLTPRFKEDYFAGKYGVRDGDVIVTKVDHIEVGDDADFKAYKDMLSTIADSDLSDEANYFRVCELVDMESWIDYYAIELYICNTDWPGNNRSLWRVRNVSDQPNEDGKWRWVLFDVNLSMDTARADDNFINRTTRRDPILASLYDSKTFRQALRRRIVKLARDNFNPNRVNAFVDEYVGRMRHAMVNEYIRFMNDRTEEDFVKACEKIKDFFRLRYDYVMEKYGGKKR